MKLYLIGHPVSHSISPEIQNAALRAVGLPPRYELLEVPPDQLAATLASLRSQDVTGCNVTVPHKQAVIPYLDEIAPRALKIGAVNTVVNREGRLIGFNTDADGFVHALREQGVSLNGAQIVLLGAGGAARAIAFAATDSGAVRLAILNRTPEAAERLADDLEPIEGGYAVGAGLDTHTLDRHLAGADLIVNATTVGLHGEPSPVPASLIPPGSAVCDIIYNPPETDLLRQARAAGARPINGLGMLVHQAALAFFIWTGKQAPLSAMYSAATLALEQRQQGAR